MIIASFVVSVFSLIISSLFSYLGYKQTLIKLKISNIDIKDNFNNEYYLLNFTITNCSKISYEISSISIKNEYQSFELAQATARIGYSKIVVKPFSSFELKGFSSQECFYLLKKPFDNGKYDLLIKTPTKLYKKSFNKSLSITEI